MRVVRKQSAKMLLVFDDLDLILKTNEKFLLGKWVHDAERWSDGNETALLKQNSLAQITIWGPSGEILDYAVKQWAGVVSHYLKPRWAVFLDSLEASLLTGMPFNEMEFKERVLREVEIPFTTSSAQFDTLPTGSSFIEALRIYQTWKRSYVVGVRQNVVTSVVRRELKTKEVGDVFSSWNQLRQLVAGSRS